MSNIYDMSGKKKVIMEEKEIIRELKSILVRTQNEKTKKAIETIINLYNDNKEWVTNLSKEVDRCHNVITGLQKTIENIETNTKIVHSSKEYNQWLNENYISKDKIEKQNKIIDLMAEQLAGLTIFDNDIESALILGDKEEVKKYYERKVANEEE